MVAVKDRVSLHAPGATTSEFVGSHGKIEDDQAALVGSTGAGRRGLRTELLPRPETSGHDLPQHPQSVVAG